MKSLLALAACLAATGCQTPPVTGPETTPRTATTNQEYELAQLRELGCAKPGTGGLNPTGLPDRAPPRTQMPVPPVNEARLPVPPPQTITPRTTATPTTSAAVPRSTTAPNTTGPVQRVGSTYMGAGGSMSRPVGAIMMNSDGTTGRLIGNTIVGQ